MYSIMDAVEAAQRRAEERDRLNQQRLPILPVQTDMQQINQYSDPSGGGDGYQAPVKDPRTPHEMYLDAIDSNQYAMNIPVIGPVMAVANDAYIEKYERENPGMVTGGASKYSVLGRIAGKGLTVEEQLQAKKDGIGLGKMLGFGGQKSTGGSQPGYSLFNRVFGTTPINVAKEGDYIGVFPGGGDGGGYEGGPIGGYSQSSLSWDNPDPEDNYGYA